MTNSTSFGARPVISPRLSLALAIALTTPLLVSRPARAQGFVRSVEYVEITLGAAQGSASANLSKSQTVTNAVPFATSTSTSAADSFGSVFTDVFLTAGTPPTVTVQRDVTSGSVTVGVFVVEFDPTYVRVQQGLFSLASGSTGPALSALPFSVDLARAALVFTHRNNFPANSNGYNVVSIEGKFSATNQLQFQRQGTGAAINGHWYVFEALGVGGSYAFDVQTKSFNFATAAGTSTALATSVLSAQTFVTGSYQTAEPNDHSNKGALRLYLSGCSGTPSTCTTISAERETANTTVWVTAYAIRLLGGGRVQRGTFNYAATGGGASLQTATLNPAFDPGRTMVWNGFGVPGIMRSNEGSGDQMGTGHQHLKLTNSTTVQGAHAFTGFTAVGTWEAVEWLTSCCNLSLTEGASTVTVTAPGSYEMRFNAATGGGIDTFHDLALDPSKSFDLAGSATSTIHESLLIDEFNVSSVWYTNERVAANEQKLDILEATPIRVKLRAEDFYGDWPGGIILPGLKAKVDYSVYSSGRMAVRWSRVTTGAVSYTSDDFPELVVHYRSPADPLSNWTPYSQSGALPNLGSDDFLLTRIDQAQVKSDFLLIRSQDWAAADATQTSTSAGDEELQSFWRDATPSVIPAGSNDTSHFLLYFKPTTFLDNNDTAVTSRRDDYRTPDSLAVLIGQPWNDASEYSSGDDFNESEGAYLVTFDPLQPTTGLRVDIDGSAVVPRRAPFFKIRQWRSLGKPTSVTLAGTTLVSDVDYKAEVKPVARAHFAQDVTWHSTLQSSAALTTTPDVGSAGAISGTVNFVPARYGNGAQITDTNSYFNFPTAGNFNPAKGAIEFWYQPTYASNDSANHTLGGYNFNGANYWLFEKDNANVLRFKINNLANGSEIVAPAGTYSWRATDWVHFRFEWDDSLPVATQLKIFVNGVEPNPGGGTGADYVSATNVSTNFQIGRHSPSGGSTGIYDEVRVYGGAGATPTPIARGGASSASEYLASTSQNFAFPFAAVNGTKQGEYVYFGSDSKFRGLNVSFSTKGVGTGLDLQWQFWDGTAWVSLEGGGFTDETNHFTKDGTVFWPFDPFNWAPYSINGGPDLYYVRAYLAAGSYSTVPVEYVIKTDILLFQYCRDITLAAQRLEIGVPLTTAVDLASFEGHGIEGGVELSWETASELHNLGFHLYRAESEKGPYERITASVIPGLGSSPSGARYRYVDPSVVSGRMYYYELEDIETNGTTMRHGPVAATPLAGVTPVSASAEMIFGRPEQTSFRVLEQNSRGLVLELLTEGFAWQGTPEGDITLSVPGFTDVSVPGAPQVPVKRAWLPIVGSREIAIASLQEEDLQFFSLRPKAADAPEIEASPRGTVRATRRARTEGALFHTKDAYPGAWARIVSDGFQGEQRKAQVELAPLRWDGATGQLVLARRLVVRVVFRGRDLRPRESRSQRSRFTARRLVTKERGVYGVSFEEIAGARGRARPVSSLNLTRLARAVPYHVEPDDGTFGPGSVLYFVSEGEALNPYGHEAVYELSYTGDGEPMEVRSATPTSAVRATVALRTVAREENRYYQAGLLEAPDLWLWDVLLSPVTKSYDFTIESLSIKSGAPVTLSVRLQGASDFPADPDHHLRVSVNGTPVEEAFSDGKRAFEIRAEIPAGLLREGRNELSIENASDTAAAYSMVMLDGFEVRYPSAPVAAGDSWEATANATGVLELAGIGTGSLVLDTTGRPVWLRGAEASGDVLRVHVEAGRRYWATSAPRKPEVRAVTTTGLRGTTKGADYIVIGPDAFLATAEPLLDLRRGQGLMTRAVSVEDIATEFGFGEGRPEAIRDYLSFAYHDGPRPAPRYVLLLGDATYDFKDYLGTGVQNRVPPLTVKTSYLWTASDPSYATIHGDDLLPDLALGRLPAANVDELDHMIRKILDYERSPGAQAPVVLVADNRDDAGDFEAHVRELASGLLASRNAKTIFLSQLGPTATRSAITEAFDSGASLLSYVGHGGIHLWAHEDVFDTAQVASLDAQERRPLLLTFNCLNGYFHFPYFNSLAEELLKADGRGAVAAFSPSGLSVDEPAHRFQKALVAAWVSGRNQRLGDAVLEAQSVYADSGAFPELLLIYHLFGDPALTLR